MPRLPRPVTKPKRRLSRVRRAWRWYQGLPQPAKHGFAFAARMAVLTSALYLNASDFDITEYKTILTMAMLDSVGFKRRT